MKSTLGYFSYFLFAFIFIYFIPKDKDERHRFGGISV
jgi:hypothetical protein